MPSQSRWTKSIAGTPGEPTRFATFRLNSGHDTLASTSAAISNKLLYNLNENMDQHLKNVRLLLFHKISQYSEARMTMTLWLYNLHTAFGQ